MRVGRSLGHVSVAVRCARVSLRDAVGVWCCAFPPVNWRAIFDWSMRDPVAARWAWAAGQPRAAVPTLRLGTSAAKPERLLRCFFSAQAWKACSSLSPFVAALKRCSSTVSPGSRRACDVQDQDQRQRQRTGASALHSRAYSEVVLYAGLEGLLHPLAF